MLTKKKTSVSLDDDLLAWIQSKIKTKKFSSVSHAIEYALEKLRREETKTVNARDGINPSHAARKGDF